ncbi:ATP-binding protein [Yinghuangia sp. ASG 101]|uniref:ATP-binding protein n=1 Tax=Yinghuangia sp. ASG 101 TaxID=2896848 RepID=UPI001E29FAA1|nr:ATP-binding protein [Yinghuangia sp. ASG 101]UGQ10395.1 ATP-binding protein [Yinghuangia sp. ASG 101]
MVDRRMSFHVPNVVASVPVARHRVMRQITVWDHGMGAEARDAFALLVSELVTNAVLHAGDRAGLLKVGVSLIERVVRIEVFDHSDRPPVLGRRDPDDAEGENGRGMFLVGALADRHGYRILGDGKSVWAERDLPPVPREAARREILREGGRTCRPAARPAPH